jgi:hypothetical protein
MVNDEISVLNCKPDVADEATFDHPGNEGKIVVPEEIGEAVELPIFKEDELLASRDVVEKLNVVVVEDEGPDDELRVPAGEDEELDVLEKAEEPLQTPTINKEKLLVAEDPGVALLLPATEERPVATREDKAELTSPVVEKTADSELGTAVVEIA